MKEQLKSDIMFTLVGSTLMCLVTIPLFAFLNYIRFTSLWVSAIYFLKTGVWVHP